MTQKHDPPIPSFGHRLRRLRRAVGMKQLALAQGLNVDQATVSRWETGNQTPDIGVQRQALSLLSPSHIADSALRRLVETSTDSVHLIDDATHICLAYSGRRAYEWRSSKQALLGISLWKFATDEIREAEAELADDGWWSEQSPAPKVLQTSAITHDQIRIAAGRILWERLYLADGTPVRLVTAL